MPPISARRASIVVAIALLLVTAGCLGAIAPSDGNGDDGDEEETDELPDADALFESAIEAESNVETVHGVQTVTTDGGDETVTTTQEVWQRGTDEYRTAVIESDESEQIDVMVSDGSTVWMYDEDGTEAVRMDLEAAGLGPAEQEELNQAFTGLLTDMEASVDGTDTVADRDVYVLELTADGEDAAYESATLWLDQETHYPVKQELTTAVGGEMTTTVAFEEVTFDEPIEDDTFEFEPPADAEVREFEDLVPDRYADVEAADAAVPFDLTEPDVPAGYELESAMVQESLVGWSATLQYADDAGTYLAVSVAEEDHNAMVEPDSDPVEIDGVDATIRTVAGSQTFLEWTDDGLSYTVSGQLEDEELIAVAESIVE